MTFTVPIMFPLIVHSSKRQKIFCLNTALSLVLKAFITRSEKRWDGVGQPTNHTLAIRDTTEAGINYRDKLIKKKKNRTTNLKL